MSDSERIRVGAVSYLNTKPLVHGLELGLGRDRIDLSYDVPAVLSERLAAREIDVALLPTIELGRIDGLTLLPGLGITALGRVRSVLLVSKVPVESIRTVALDPESRTSNALVQVLFAEHWGNRPSFPAAPPGGDLSAALDGVDACVRIGDKAMTDEIPDGIEVIDLSEAWHRHFELPFVFAGWIAHADVPFLPELVGWLERSYESGRAAVESIAAEHAASHGVSVATAVRYLTEDIRFRIGPAELDGLRLFLELAARHGLVEHTPEVRLAEVAAADVSSDGRQAALHVTRNAG